MKLSKKVIIWALGILVLLLGILAMGEIDFSISKAIINKHSIWAEFFNMFGEVPANLGVLIGVSIFYGLRNREVLWKNILATIISIPFMLIFSFMVVFMPIRYVYEFEEAGVPKVLSFVALGLAVALTVAAIFITKKIGRKNLREYRNIGIIFILLVVLEILVVNVLKVVWARPRMRSIETIEQFRYWFQINGPASGEEFKSFPSGHTANAFVMVAYTMFLPYFKKVNKVAFSTFTVAWGTLVALSRVVLGAHFLSDVLIGGYITILLFFGLNIIFNKKQEEANTESQEK